MSPLRLCLDKGHCLGEGACVKSGLSVWWMT